MKNGARPDFTPLAGTRVLDLSRAVSGPIAAHLLADLGAEVIKVEPPGGDPLRHGHPAVEGDRPWDRVPHFNELHRGKLGLALDLRHPLGRGLVERLLGVSDLLIENFSVRAAEALGLTADALAACHPKLIAISVSAFGRTGPYGRWTGYGPGIDAASGLAAMTGYADSGPLKPANFFCDHLAGVSAALLAIASLYRSRNHAGGFAANVAMREAETPLVADALISAGMHRRSPQRLANRHPVYAPQGVYPCRGDNRWIAISVRSDAEWRVLCEVLERPDLGSDDRFSRMASRRDAGDELDPILATVTRQWEASDLMTALQQRGIAAGVVHDVQGALTDPQVRHRGYFRPLPDSDIPEFTVRGALWRLARARVAIDRPAPRFGQHNTTILREVLRLSDREIDELRAAGVLVDQPRRGGHAD